MFRIGSVTKSFVALSVSQLVEQGRLSLDDQLRDIAPEIPFENKWKDTNPVKIANLLEHTAGWDDLHMKEYATNGEGWSTLQGLQYHPDSKYSRWRPGTHFSYCNAGPPAAGYVVEKITGEKIEEYIERKIFKPLGMEHSSLFKTEHVDQHLSKGYYGEHNTEAPYWHIIDRAAGSINSTATEMGHYVQMYLNRGRADSVRNIVSSGSISRMEYPMTTLSGKDDAGEGYGLHISSKYFKDEKVCGHSGGMAGFLTMMNYFPDKGIGYFYSINKNGDGFRDIDRAVLNFLVDPDSTWQQATLPTTGYDKSAIGYYRSATSRNQMIRFLEWLPDVMKVYERKDTLFRKPILGGEESVLYVINPTTFRNYSKEGNSTMVKLLEDEDGQTIIQTSSGTNLYKTTTSKAWGFIAAAALSILLMATTILFALFWIPMAIFKKNGIRFKRARIFPLLASLCFFGLTFFFIGASEVGDAIQNLGNPTKWSIGIFVVSLLLGIFALMSGWYAIRSLGANMHNGARIHSILASFAVLFVAGYLAYWGGIGLMTWAY